MRSNQAQVATNALEDAQHVIEVVARKPADIWVRTRALSRATIGKTIAPAMTPSSASAARGPWRSLMGRT